MAIYGILSGFVCGVAVGANVGIASHNINYATAAGLSILLLGFLTSLICLQIAKSSK